ncbi:uncharacterized protein LOC125476091 [Pyrus x bretschneideri]|uniref:uncharacterized protein LOC125476091 n=1 Tax=Pyrus x bretschneideri TaxID=225117 RepID=UPI00202FB243|nr:uncharacterized protein LOC125476091 [Pyrus x bretschneideri]
MHACTETLTIAHNSSTPNLANSGEFTVFRPRSSYRKTSRGKDPQILSKEPWPSDHFQDVFPASSDCVSAPLRFPARTHDHLASFRPLFRRTPIITRPQMGFSS